MKSSILPANTEPMKIPAKQVNSDPDKQASPNPPYSSKTQSEQMAAQQLADRLRNVGEKLNSETNKNK